MRVHLSYITVDKSQSGFLIRKSAPIYFLFIILKNVTTRYSLNMSIYSSSYAFG